MVTLQYADRKLGQDAESNADQTEYAALKYKLASVESGIEDERLAGVLDDYENAELEGEQEEWALDDAAKDDAAGLTLDKLKHRQAVLGDLYPFEINGNQVSLKEGDVSPVYLFCLAISNAPYITKGEFVQLPRTFEQLSARLGKLVLGNSAHSMHTGWPRQDENPISFKELIDLIKSKVNAKFEWNWDPQLGLDTPEARYLKDCGLDFIVWRDFYDNRDGKLYLAGQCACGNDWTDKFGDINYNNIKKWVRPFAYIPPTKILTIPFCADECYMLDSADNENLILDRIRLTKLYPRMKNGNIDDLKLGDLVNLVLEST